MGGPPRELPDDREAFNVTDDVLGRLPLLSDIFELPGHTIILTCDEGVHIMRGLEAEGADVVFLEQTTGHNAYLTRNGTSYHVVLRARA